MRDVTTYYPHSSRSSPIYQPLFIAIPYADLTELADVIRWREEKGAEFVAFEFYDPLDWEDFARLNVYVCLVFKRDADRIEFMLRFAPE